MADQLASRRRLMFRVPVEKIRKIFKLRRLQIRERETSLMAIGVKVNVPWQTVDALLHNPNCMQMVSEDLWTSTR
jgi:hypothetical protein